MPSLSAKPRLDRVPPFSVLALWPAVEAWVVAACEHNGGEATPGEVRGWCEDGRFDLWRARIGETMVGVIITEMQCLPTRTVMQVLYLAGDRLDEWLHLQDDLAGWAGAHGCEALRIKGRSGWTRRLAAHGWRQTAVEMERAI